MPNEKPANPSAVGGPGAVRTFRGGMTAPNVGQRSKYGRPIPCVSGDVPAGLSAPLPVGGPQLRSIALAVKAFCFGRIRANRFVVTAAKSGFRLKVNANLDTLTSRPDKRMKLG
jgi:hypothetical protein